MASENTTGRVGNGDAGWINLQLKEAERRAKRSWGHGWQILSLDMQYAYVAREVLAVIAAQHNDGNTLVRLATEGCRYESA